VFFYYLLGARKKKKKSLDAILLPHDKSEPSTRRGSVGGCRQSASRRSPQGERPLLVAAQPAAVDGGGAGYCVQVVGTVGQRGNPLAAPLGLLLPAGSQKGGFMRERGREGREREGRERGRQRGREKERRRKREGERRDRRRDGEVGKG